MTTAADIFLSYSRDDQATARRFAEGLAREGFSVWWDVTLKSGEDYDKVTEDALRGAKAVVVLWSKKSVESRWVRAEATEADSLGTLVPVMIEPCKRPIMFELKQSAELSHWKGDASDTAWRALVSDIRRFVGKDAAPSSVAHAAAAPARTQWYRTALGQFSLTIVVALILSIALLPLRTLKTPDAPSDISLAVLPFDNLSSDPQQEYFSDGLAEELLNQLAQVKDLRVIARTSSFSFKGTKTDVRTIGDKLGAANVLEGSVQKDGNNLRINARLINAKTGSELWSQKFDRKLESVFAIQEEIAGAVTRALSIKLDVGELSRANGGTNNIDAFDEFLRARQLRNQSGTDNMIQARQHYRRAVELDPGFVSAWSELGDLLTTMLIYVQESAVQLRSERNEVMTQLKQLAPTAWQTHVLSAILLAEQLHWQEAEAEAKLVVATHPTSTLNSNFFIAILYAVGRPSELVPLYERAVRNDPQSLNESNNLHVAYFFANRLADSEAEYQHSKLLSGNRDIIDGNNVLHTFALDDAHTAAGRERIRQALKLYAGNSLISVLSPLAELLDDPPRAMAYVKSAIENPAMKNATNMASLAVPADYFGNKALALAAYRRAYLELGGINYGAIWGHTYSNYRADPAFKQLLRDLKLTDYFRATGNYGEFCHPVGADDFECK
ncbi:MAG TPA: TIR domain-containing protein [Candidatus Acidoferrum sp.]|nr:TIR domain-containing protein [Candidatus Acidoferrum sp.]